MAKKITDADFNVGYALPEGVVNDFDLFRKPQVRPQNPAVQDLITSLSNIVPTLATYDIIEQQQAKATNEAKAVEDYNINRKAFGQLVKNNNIPAGANPHYFNKMMELDLASKARDFQKKFDIFYKENNLVDRNKDDFKQQYELQLKDFYNMNGLDKYDPLALNKAFFSTTSKYREDKARTHNTNRLNKIENHTKQLSIKNYAGGLVDLQMQDASTEEVHNFFKKETTDYIDLTGSPRTANEILLAGIKTYVDAVNSPEGFDFAKKVVDDLSTLNLGTGDFAGSNRVNIIQKQLQNSLLDRELNYIKKKNEFNKVRKDRNSSSLENAYYTYKQNNPDFNIADLINQKVDDTEFALDKFTAREKDELIKFHNSITNATTITRSTSEAILELDTLDRENPYAVRDRARELMEAGELTQTDYLRFSNAAGKRKLLEDNIFFRQSREYQTLKDFFDSPTLAQIPTLKTEVPLLRLDFEDKLVRYYESLKDTEISPNELQLRLNGQVRLLLGEALQNSLIFRDNKELLQDLVNRYGITIN